MTHTNTQWQTYAMTNIHIMIDTDNDTFKHNDTNTMTHSHKKTHWHKYNDTHHDIIKLDGLFKDRYNLLNKACIIS